MRRVYEPEQLIPLFEEARSESLACFGSGEMYLEKLIVNPRHIEFQIMADGQGHVIQLGDRDCSIQRRNQKLLEESPSKALTPELRERMARRPWRPPGPRATSTPAPSSSCWPPTASSTSSR